MAAKMPPRPAVAQLKPLTEGEVAVQKRQGAAIQDDVRALTGLDIHKPFQNLQDAIQRLIPFHVFAAADASEADLDETPDHAGSQLMASRREAWNELSVQKAIELRQRAEAIEQAVSQLEEKHQKQQDEGMSAVDRWNWERFLEDDAKKNLAREKGGLALHLMGGTQQQQQHQQQQQVALLQQLGYSGQQLGVMGGGVGGIAGMGLPPQQMMQQVKPPPPLQQQQLQQQYHQQQQQQLGGGVGSSALVLTRPGQPHQQQQQPQQQQQMLLLTQQQYNAIQQQQHAALQQQQMVAYQQQQQAAAAAAYQQQQVAALQQQQQHAALQHQKM